MVFWIPLLAQLQDDYSREHAHILKVPERAWLPDHIADINRKSTVLGWMGRRVGRGARLETVTLDDKAGTDCINDGMGPC